MIEYPVYRNRAEVEDEEAHVRIAGNKLSTVRRVRETMDIRLMAALW
jgi:hypothetical protein